MYKQRRTCRYVNLDDILWAQDNLTREIIVVIPKGDTTVHHHPHFYYLFFIFSPTKCDCNYFFGLSGMYLNLKINGKKIYIYLSTNPGNSLTTSSRVKEEHVGFFLSYLTIHQPQSVFKKEKGKKNKGVP